MSDSLVIIISLVFFIIVPPVTIALFRKQKDTYLDPATIESMSTNPDLADFDDDSNEEEEPESSVSEEIETEEEPPTRKFTRRTNPKHHFK